MYLTLLKSIRTILTSSSSTRTLLYEIVAPNRPARCERPPDALPIPGPLGCGAAPPPRGRRRGGPDSRAHGAVGPRGVRPQRPVRAAACTQVPLNRGPRIRGRRAPRPRDEAPSGRRDERPTAPRTTPGGGHPTRLPPVPQPPRRGRPVTLRKA